MKDLKIATTVFSIMLQRDTEISSVLSYSVHYTCPEYKAG